LRRRDARQLSVVEGGGDVAESAPETTLIEVVEVDAGEDRAVVEVYSGCNAVRWRRPAQRKLVRGRVEQ